MYMNYLLGYRLNAQSVPSSRRTVAFKNTYILALDGDVDFKPKSVILLMDLMKRNDKVGAACGRIHPVGSGKNHFILETNICLTSYFTLFVTSVHCNTKHCPAVTIQI